MTMMMMMSEICLVLREGTEESPRLVTLSLLYHFVLLDWLFLSSGSSLVIAQGRMNVLYNE